MECLARTIHQLTRPSSSPRTLAPSVDKMPAVDLTKFQVDSRVVATH